MKKIGVHLNNLKLRKPFIAILLSLGLSQPVIGLELQNKTGDDIQVSIKGYDKNNNQKIQTLEIKAHATGKVMIDNCPTVNMNDPYSDKKACIISLSGGHSPHHSGIHLLSNNAEKDETFKVTISEEKYEVSPE